MDSQGQQHLSKSINHFSNNLFKIKSSLNPNDSLVMSPISVEIILALLSLGASDETLAELDEKLLFPNKQFAKLAFKELLEDFKFIKEILSIANKIYVKDGEKYALNADFKKDAVEIFSSDIENLDFSKSSEAAGIINAWVEKKTNDRIKNLIKPDVLNDSTSLVLVNAIYFKGAWKSVFRKERTSLGNFYLNSKNVIQMEMMHQTDNFGYVELPELNAKVLEMPFEIFSVSMVIILPNEIEGLKALEDKLSEINFTENVLCKLKTFEVEVQLPRFKIETEIDLKPVLKQFGIKLIFDPERADLGGFLRNAERLYVSTAIQKAFIEINEEGAEAAAATFFAMERCCAMIIPDEKKTFIVDRSFYYALRFSDNILFHGKYLGGN